jgi:hypothetical protein
MSDTANKTHTMKIEDWLWDLTMRTLRELFPWGGCGLSATVFTWLVEERSWR